MSHYLGWSYGDVMSMDHRERQRWVAEIARMNELKNEQGARRERGI